MPRAGAGDGEGTGSMSGDGAGAASAADEAIPGSVAAEEGGMPGGMMPMMGAGGAPDRESSTRKRPAWLVEPEETWAVDGVTVPAEIGRRR